MNLGLGTFAYGYFVFIWTIIALIVALGGGITFYIIFLRSKKPFKGFLKVMHDFFTFKSLLLEEILKLTYMIFAIYITVVSIAYIYPNPVAFLLMLIGGNAVLRIVYEMAILLIKICRNTTEINEKIKK